MCAAAGSAKLVSRPLWSTYFEPMYEWLGGCLGSIQVQGLVDAEEGVVHLILTNNEQRVDLLQVLRSINSR